MPVEAPPQPEQATMVCLECWKEQPIELFRRYRKGGTKRHSECNGCRNEVYREARAAKKRGEIGKYASRLNDLKNDPQAVAALTIQFIRRWGGVEKFADAYVAAINVAREGGRSGMVGRMMLAVPTLLHAGEELKAPSDRFDNMTDTEVEAAFQKSVIEVIEANPSIAVAVLCDLGWTCTPPASE